MIKSSDNFKRKILPYIVGGLVTIGACLFTIDKIASSYSKNHLAMQELLPLIEMEDGRPGLSKGDTFNFYRKIGYPYRYSSTDTTLNDTPRDIYGTFQNLSRDSIESLIRSYKK